MTRNGPRIAVVGAGYVGIATAVVVAAQRCGILLVDQYRDRAGDPSPFGDKLDGRASLEGAAVASHTIAFPLGGLVVCPVCREPLSLGPTTYTCAGCPRSFPVIDGIPILLPVADLSKQDEIDHGHDDHGSRGEAHKTAQAKHFDRAVAEEFEITRPHGTPRLYRFFIDEKFRRATAPIGPHLAGATALTVCGGSGMDAEFLARAGASVVASDVSLGAALRTRERARRYGLDITPIVADVERLPFSDGTVDLVMVHDGLHHLERPAVGLNEMARVARRWVSLSEPARAAATAVGVRLGLALDREEAGNQVARLTLAEIVETLDIAGFGPLVAQRYAMYYRHRPGSIFRALSARPFFPLFRAGWRVGNGLIGWMGNKLVVVAERQDGSTKQSSSFRDRRSRPPR